MSDTDDRARPLIPKLARALRQHRQRVFDPRSGEAHERALRRLKRTATFRCLCRDNADAARLRAGERLAAMGY